MKELYAWRIVGCGGMEKEYKFERWVGWEEMENLGLPLPKIKYSEIDFQRHVDGTLGDCLVQDLYLEHFDKPLALT